MLFKIQDGSRHHKAMIFALRTFVMSCLLLSAGNAMAAIIENVRFWTAPDHTRVVMDLSGPAAYSVKRVGNPERIAINMPGSRFAETKTIEVNDKVLLRIRRNAMSRKAQLVLDIKGRFEYRDFSLKAEAGRPDRIVIDIYRPVDGAVDETVPVTEQAAVVKPETESRAEPYTIVIDPGHGGLDPGAIRHNVREKDVVLQLSKKLAAIFNAKDGYRAVLTRKSDYFVSLGDRVRIAKKAEGDLFLSIHANTHRKSTINGMEVYLLNMKGASDREARELANKENASDMVGLAPNERGDDDVLSILMDLRRGQVMSSSSRLADHLVATARRSDVVKGKGIKQAGFRVLHSLAMPSALIEVAYLSNNKDRRLLTSGAGQQDLARTIADGVFNFLGDQDDVLYTEGGAWLREYRVRRGDNLWDLARKNGTTMAEIRRHNNLKSDGLRIGQKLILP
jgi:N-acetylmuramoyl-L-alanine amidase